MARSRVPPTASSTGRAKIADIYRYWFTAFPDLQLTLGPPIVGDGRAAVFWKFVGTAHGPFFGIAGAGTRIEMSGAAEFLVATARSKRPHIFDFSGVLMKTGVLKVKPG
jgi:predicted ester cyclase